MKAGIVALAAEAVLVYGLFLRQLVVVQYSVTSGICMAGAVFLFLTAPGDGQAVGLFSGETCCRCFLVVLSFLIRTEVCVMLLPFLLFAGLLRWCGEARFFTAVNFRKYITLIVTALLCLAAVYSDGYGRQRIYPGSFTRYDPGPDSASAAVQAPGWGRTPTVGNFKEMIP